VIGKIAIEKVQISTLATYFSIHTLTDSLFYYLFSSNIIFLIFFLLFYFLVSLWSLSPTLSQPSLSLVFLSNPIDPYATAIIGNAQTRNQLMDASNRSDVDLGGVDPSRTPQGSVKAAVENAD
jgi:hypothetical protein